MNATYYPSMQSYEMPCLPFLDMPDYSRLDAALKRVPARFWQDDPIQVLSYDDEDAAAHVREWARTAGLTCRFSTKDCNTRLHIVTHPEAALAAQLNADLRHNNMIICLGEDAEEVKRFEDALTTYACRYRLDNLNVRILVSAQPILC